MDFNRTCTESHVIFKKGFEDINTVGDCFVIEL